MIIFNDKFSALRNKYVIPLIGYAPKNVARGNFDLKDMLSSKIDGVDIGASNNSYYLKISNTAFFNSLTYDIELFYTRMIAQYVDLHKNANSSPAWQYVTSYYLFFFSITTLLRLSHSGFVYFNEDHAKKLSGLLTAIGNQAIKINSGNYSFLVFETLTDYVTIELKPTAGDVHKTTWEKSKKLIYDLSMNGKNNDENTILQTLNNINNSSSFPSEIRNKINYNGIYGLETIENRIYKNGLITNTDSFSKQIFTYKKSSNDDINSSIKYSCLYGSYIFSLTHKLYEEYRQRITTSKHCFYKLRSDFLKKNSIELMFLDNC